MTHSEINGKYVDAKPTGECHIKAILHLIQRGQLGATEENWRESTNRCKLTKGLTTNKWTLIYIISGMVLF